MKKHFGVVLGLCLFLTLLSVSSVSSAAPQIVGSKCVKAGTFRTAKTVKYQCKKSAQGLRWVITSIKSTTTTTTLAKTTTTCSRSSNSGGPNPDTGGALVAGYQYIKTDSTGIVLAVSYHTNHVGQGVSGGNIWSNNGAWGNVQVGGSIKSENSGNIYYPPACTPPITTSTVTTTTTTTSSTTTTTLPVPDPVITNVESCRLKSALESKSGGIGFPRHTTKLRSTGGVRLLVLFVDFPDSVATKSTESVLKIISPESERLYSEMSYGRVAFELVLVNRWLRMSKESSAYDARRGSSGFNHRNYLEEALRLGIDGLDASTLDGFIVLTNPETKTIEFGPAFALDDEFWGIRTGSKLWMNGASSGFDLNYWGYKWMNHEIGHTMGLPDLYAYSDGSHRFVGGWSLMGLISGHAPEFFAWERWLLSWLDDNQVICLPNGSITATLNAVPVVGGQKMIVTPINQYQAVVVEVRRQLGNDFNVREEGPLVYLVDTRLRGGNGVIKVLPINDIDVEKKSAPLSVGETLIFEGVSIRYNSRTSYGDEITVSRN